MAEVVDRFDRVTEAQRQCLRLVLTRRNSKEIAQVLGISPHTVDKRLERAVATLGSTGRFEAARMLGDYEAPTPAPASTPAAPTYDPFVYQSPDIAPPAQSDMLGVSEGLAQGVSGQNAKASWPPIRPRGGRYNTLSPWQRLSWIGMIPAALAVAVGMLGFGLSVAGKLFRLFASVLP